MKDIIYKEVQNNGDLLFQIAKYLYENPELGNEEHLACKRLIDEFKERGFVVEEGICNLDTAFKAVYDSGKEGVSIAYFCEYDALPSIGHGCGHNLISAMSLGAAIGLKAVIDDIGGKIVVFGTPAEETDGAKVHMTEKNIFDGITAGIMAHPSTVTEESGTSMAIRPVRFQFTGKAAHAAAAPEKGINALDAVIFLFNAVNALRQHVPRDVMFHGIITKGGDAPNIVPEFAEAFFYIRAGKKNVLSEAVHRVEECARGAEKMTGAKVNIIYEPAFDDLNTNIALSEAFNVNFLSFGEKDIKKAGDGLGSIDIGNVSYSIPCIHPWIGLGDENLVLHTKDFADRTVDKDVNDIVVRAAAAMAATGFDVITSKELQKEIEYEFIHSK
jgi:amidohydrolase